VLEAQARRVVLKWPAEHAGGACEKLAQILTRFRPGACPVTIEYRTAQAAGALTLGAEWSVRPSRELVGELQGLLGRDAVELRFGAASSAELADSLADAGPRP
jgi:DNA polymerase III subunit alpha